MRPLDEFHQLVNRLASWLNLEIFLKGGELEKNTFGHIETLVSWGQNHLANLQLIVGWKRVAIYIIIRHEGFVAPSMV